MSWNLSYVDMLGIEQYILRVEKTTTVKNTSDFGSKSSLSNSMGSLILGL